MTTKSHANSRIARELLAAHPEFDAPHSLEDDESIPPRPEDDAADVARTASDAEDAIVKTTPTQSDH